jgi:tetratricopeptide (TPR) repeat protein
VKAHFLAICVFALYACEAQTDSTSPNFLYRQEISKALNAKEYTKCIAYLDSLINLEPAFDLLYNLRACCYIYKGSINDAYNDSIAISNWDQAIELNSKEAMYYYNRGYIQLIQDNYEEAERDYTMAYMLEPDDKRYHHGYLKIKMIRNKNEEALEIADEVIAKYPKDGYAYYIRGNLKRDYLKRYKEGNVDIAKGKELGWNGGFGLLFFK